MNIGGLTIENFLGEKFLERFRVFNPTSLFPPDFNMLKDSRCPLCNYKLYFPRSGKIAFCKSKRNDKFVITKARLDSYLKSVS